MFFMRHIKSKVNVSAHAQHLVTVQSLHGQTTLTPPLQEHRVIQGNTATAHKDSPSFATRVWVPPGTLLTGTKWIQSIWFTGTSLTLYLRNCFLKDENFFSFFLLGKWNSNFCLILWKWGDGSHSHGRFLAIEHKGSYLCLQGGHLQCKDSEISSRSLSLLTKQHHFKNQKFWNHFWRNKLFDCVEECTFFKQLKTILKQVLKSLFWQHRVGLIMKLTVVKRVPEDVWSALINQEEYSF